MKFDLSNIKFSNKDVKDSVKIPKELTPELAEFIGIMVGDGHVGMHKNNNPNPHIVRHIGVTGNLKDIYYYEHYLNPLIKEIFNITFSLKTRSRDNTVTLIKGSKAIYYFLKDIIKLPSVKNNISIPKIIIESSKEIKSSFLRGFFDADGCFVVKYKPNTYPVVQTASKSSQLIKQIVQLLNELNIACCSYKETNRDYKRNKIYIRHSIYINGRKRVKKYFEKIGFSNRNKQKKYKKFLESE